MATKANVNVKGGADSEGYRNVKFLSTFDLESLVIPGPGRIISIFGEARGGGTTAYGRINDFVVDGVATNLPTTLFIGSNHNGEDAASAASMAFPWDFDTSFEIQLIKAFFNIWVVYVTY